MATAFGVRCTAASAECPAPGDPVAQAAQLAAPAAPLKQGAANMKRTHGSIRALTRALVAALGHRVTHRRRLRLTRAAARPRTALLHHGGVPGEACQSS